MIAKYSVEWVKDIVKHFAEISHFTAEGLPRELDRTIVHNSSHQLIYSKFISREHPYVIVCTSEAAIKSRALKNEYIKKVHGYKHGFGLIDEDLPWFTDRRLLSLFHDTYPGTKLETSVPEVNDCFFNVFNGLQSAWFSLQKRDPIDWDQLVSLIKKNIVRNILNPRLETEVSDREYPDKFLLRPDEMGFVYRNRYFSVNQVNKYELKPIPYYIVLHLYHNLGHDVYGTDLRKLVRDSRPRFKNGKVQKVSQPLTTYFSDLMGSPVKNLLDTLVKSTGLHGAYRLQI